MDSQLTKVIHQLKAGSSVTFPSSSVGTIENEKLGLVARRFAQRVYGVKFSDVFDGLDCLDAALEHGRGVAFGLAQRFTPKEDTVIAASFVGGQTCERKLANELHQRKAVPRGVVASMATIDKQVTKVIHKLNAHGYAYFPTSRVGKIQAETVALVGHFFAQPVYDVTLNEVFGRLDCLDRGMGYGRGLVRAFGHTLTSSGANLVATSFQAGMKCKQALEDELRKTH